MEDWRKLLLEALRPRLETARSKSELEAFKARLIRLSGVPEAQQLTDTVDARLAELHAQYDRMTDGARAARTADEKRRALDQLNACETQTDEVNALKAQLAADIKTAEAAELAEKLKALAAEADNARTLDAKYTVLHRVEALRGSSEVSSALLARLRAEIADLNAAQAAAEKRRSIIIGAALAAICVSLLLYFEVIKPDTVFSKGTQLAESGDYTGALDCYSQYKNERFTGALNDTLGKAVRQLLDNGSGTEALDLLEKYNMAGTELMESTAETAARQLLDNGSGTEALALLNKYNVTDADFRDDVVKAVAQQLIDRGSGTGALELLEKYNVADTDFRDNAVRTVISQLVAAGSGTEALELLEKYNVADADFRDNAVRTAVNQLVSAGSGTEALKLINKYGVTDEELCLAANHAAFVELITQEVPESDTAQTETTDQTGTVELSQFKKSMDAYWKARNRDSAMDSVRLSDRDAIDLLLHTDIEEKAVYYYARAFGRRHTNVDDQLAYCELLRAAGIDLARVYPDGVKVNVQLTEYNYASLDREPDQYPVPGKTLVFLRQENKHVQKQKYTPGADVPLNDTSDDSAWTVYLMPAQIFELPEENRAMTLEEADTYIIAENTYEYGGYFNIVTMDGTKTLAGIDFTYYMNYYLREDICVYDRDNPSRCGMVYYSYHESKSMDKNWYNAQDPDKAEFTVSGAGFINGWATTDNLLGQPDESDPLTAHLDEAVQAPEGLADAYIYGQVWRRDK